MTLETHHQALLIERAKLELDRAHRAALSMQAAEIRRGVQIAIESLREAAEPIAEPAATVPPADTLRGLIATLEEAQADLQAGKLAELGNLMETVRKALGA